jgi:predicted Zn-dependent peptidase
MMTKTETKVETSTMTRTTTTNTGARVATSLVLAAVFASCASAPTPAPAPVAPAVAVEATPAPKPVAAAPVVAAAPPAPAPTTPDAPFRAQAPAPGPEPHFQVPGFKRFKLKNGLQVVLAEFHDLPLVDLNLIVKSGGGANPPELAGLAEMTANMLDEGTKTRTALQISDQIAALGATLTTGSSWDASTAALSTLTKNLDGALAIWADVIQNPGFSDKEFARVRDNVLTAVARRKDSPPTLASLSLSRILYGERHPYGWPITGVEASLKKLTPADLHKFYETYYRPNNAVLIVAGDVTEATLRAKLEGAFKGWKARPVSARKLPAPPAAAKTKVYLVDKADAPQSSIRVGQIGIDRNNPDYIPATVMNLILGGGFYRLDLNLREGKGWTYGARSMFEARKAPGPFGAGGEFVATHTADSVAEILKEINTIRDADVTDAELARAKDQIVKSFPARFATRASTAGQLAEIAIYGLPDSYLADFTRKVMAVSKEDVHRMARKYFDPSKMAIVVIGDQKSNREALDKIARVEMRDLEGNPISPASAAPVATEPAKGTPASKREE